MLEVGGVAAGDGPAAPSAASSSGPAGGSAGVALAVVTAALDALLGVDLAVPGTGELLDLLRGIERQSRRLAAVSVAVVGQIDGRGLAAPAGHRSTSVLVRQVITIGKDESDRRVRLAAAVCPTVGLTGAVIPPRFPQVAAAVVAGGVGVRQADLICATIKGFPAGVAPDTRDGAETFLVEQAAVLDPATFKQVAREIALLADPDGTPDDRDVHERMQFHLGRRREDGLTRCWGLLDDLTAESMREVFGSMCSPSAERNQQRADQADTDTDDASAGEPGDGPNRDEVGPDGDDAGRAAAEPPVNPVPDTDPDLAASDGDVPSSGTGDGDRDDVASQPFLPDPTAGDDTHSGTDAHDDFDQADPAVISGEGQAADGAPPGPPPDPAPNPAPATSTGAVQGRPHPDCSGRGSGSGSEDEAGGYAGPVWRAPRLPYEWAPLGTVASDYNPPAGPADTDNVSTDYPDPVDEETRSGCASAGTLTGSGATPDPGAPPDRRSAGTRRAQALTIVFSKFLDAGIAPTQGGERPHLVVTIDEQSLRERTTPARLGFGDRIPAGQLRLLACDATIIPAVLAGPSEILDVGRSMRTFTAACRKALLLRDVGCVFPGCHLPGKWAEFHHITHWCDGGPSDLNNGCVLCRQHHTLIHHSDWQVRLGPDGLPEIIPPITYDLEQRPQRNTLHRPPTFPWPQVG